KRSWRGFASRWVPECWELPRTTSRPAGLSISLSQTISSTESRGTFSKTLREHGGVPARDPVSLPPPVRHQAQVKRYASARAAVCRTQVNTPITCKATRELIGYDGAAPIVLVLSRSCQSLGTSLVRLRTARHVRPPQGTLRPPVACRQRSPTLPTSETTMRCVSHASLRATLPLL